MLLVCREATACCGRLGRVVTITMPHATGLPHHSQLVFNLRGRHTLCTDLELASASALCYSRRCRGQVTLRVNLVFKPDMYQHCQAAVAMSACTEPADHGRW
jgi:hypothetical protein